MDFLTPALLVTIFFVITFFKYGRTKNADYDRLDAQYKEIVRKLRNTLEKVKDERNELKRENGLLRERNALLERNLKALRERNLKALREQTNYITLYDYGVGDDQYDRMLLGRKITAYCRENDIEFGKERFYGKQEFLRRIAKPIKGDMGYFIWVHAYPEKVLQEFFPVVHRRRA